MSAGEAGVGLSDALKRAIDRSFDLADRPGVAAELERITAPANGTAEVVRGCVLALAFGDTAAVSELVGLSLYDARDILYMHQQPELFRDGLTADELVRRYRTLGLAVPYILTKRYGGPA